MKKNKTNGPVKTYYKGNLIEFPTRLKALRYYTKASYETSNYSHDAYDRFSEIASKLHYRREPFCDIDGVPASPRRITEEEFNAAKKLYKKLYDASNKRNTLRDNSKADWNEMMKACDIASRLEVQIAEYEKLGLVF